MPLSKKQKVIVGSCVGAVLLAAGIGITVYMLARKDSGGTGGGKPTPPTVTWTCADDGQSSTVLLSNNAPCAKYDTNAMCQAAATAGTVQCSCTSGQVLYNNSCTALCLDTSTWDNTTNKCVCPSNTQFNSIDKKCETPCPPANVDPLTGKVSGDVLVNGTCTSVANTTTSLPELVTLCQSTPCQEPTVCVANSKFVDYDAATHTCVAPNKCNGISYIYTWPDGSNTCPGLTYGLGGDGQCTSPSNDALQVACEYNASGCGPGLVPVRAGQETCASISGGTASSVPCRSIGDSGSCPSGSALNTSQCPVPSQGQCYNSALNKCVPLQYQNCIASSIICPSNASYSTTCPAATPCLEQGTNNCVASYVGCRPDFENWKFDTTYDTCTNVTTNTSMTVALAPGSNTNTITVNTSGTYSAPLSSVQFRYVMVETAPSSSTGGGLVVKAHWAGVASQVQLSPTDPSSAILTLYPDQTEGAVPAQTNLLLLIIGLIQQSDGTWTPVISSPPLTSTEVVTISLAAGPAACLPTVGFSVNDAHTLAYKLQSLPPTVAVTPDATTVGLSVAASQPLVLSTAGAFAGAIVPVANPTYGTQVVSKMFVVLAWNEVPASALKGETATYCVTKVSQGQENVNVYSGPLTALVDVVDVNATVATTYQLQAQTSSSGGCGSSGSTTCASPVQSTTCPPLMFTGQMCTSMKNGSASVINFMIPQAQGSGCVTIPASDEQNAAFYSCAYLNNPNRSVNLSGIDLSSIQVPNSGSTACVSMNAAQPVVAKELQEVMNTSGQPTGYCSGNFSGYLDTSRSAVCACAGDAGQCADKTAAELPFVSLSNGDLMGASDFATGMKGMASFIQRNQKLIF